MKRTAANTHDKLHSDPSCRRYLRGFEPSHPHVAENFVARLWTKFFRAIFVGASILEDQHPVFHCFRLLYSRVFRRNSKVRPSEEFAINRHRFSFLLYYVIYVFFLARHKRGKTKTSPFRGLVFDIVKVGFFLTITKMSSRN